LALEGLAQRSDAHRATHLLGAKNAQDRALSVFNPRDDLRRWLATKCSLGATLAELAALRREPERSTLLQEAADTLQEARRAVTPNGELPLRAMAEYFSGRVAEARAVAEGADRLAEAVERYERAAAFLASPEYAFYRSTVHFSLGDVYKKTGLTRSGGEAISHLKKAVASYKEARAGLNPREFPRKCARIQDNLGYVLAALGRQQSGPDGLTALQEAVTAYQEELAYYSADTAPADWARSQYNIGITFVELAKRQDPTEKGPSLVAAAEAFRMALRVYNDASNRWWFGTQTQLGSTLLDLAKVQTGAEVEKSLVRASDAYRQAVIGLTRERRPNDWAMANYDYGRALLRLGQAQGARGLPRLTQAVEAETHALTVWKKQSSFREWESAQNALGLVLQYRLSLSGFRDELSLIAELSNTDGVRDDPHIQASLQTLAVVCHVGANQNTEASRTFIGLVELIQLQPAEFVLGWSWKPLREYLARSSDSAITARRRSLEQFLNAIDGENKAAILGRLQELRDVFAPATEESRKQ
jgi:tetratricopeptide (TPR) repeat protein